MLLYFSIYLLIISSELSLLPSFTIISSRSLYVPSNILFIHLSKYFSTLKTGRIILNEYDFFSYFLTILNPLSFSSFSILFSLFNLIILLFYYFFTYYFYYLNYFLILHIIILLYIKYIHIFIDFLNHFPF